MSKDYIDDTDLYYCPNCGGKELVFLEKDEPYCQVCGAYVEPEEDHENHQEYFESLEGVDVSWNS